MSLSRATVETLIDLVEIKLSCVEVYDRDDSRELANLQRCKEELLDIVGLGGKAPAELITMPRTRRRGRRPNA
jgi:hypothetical protein